MVSYPCRELKKGLKVVDDQDNKLASSKVYSLEWYTPTTTLLLKIRGLFAALEVIYIFGR